MLRGLVAAGLPAEPDAPIGARTWYRCGGRAELLAKPRTVGELAEIRRRSADSGLALRVLGGGANLLVTEGRVPGVTVRLEGPGFDGIAIEERLLVAGAGVDLYALVTAAARAGLAGLARVAGVPGSVGGGVAMNAGGAYGAIGDRLVSATLLDAAGRLERVPTAELGLGYRRSGLGGRLVVSASFVLVPEDPATVRARVRERLALKKADQPLAAKSAGCAFKNPSARRPRRAIPTTPRPGPRASSSTPRAARACGSARRRSADATRTS